MTHHHRLVEPNTARSDIRVDTCIHRLFETPIAHVPYSITTLFEDTRSEIGLDMCIQHLFEAQVARTPDSVAVVFEDEYLTYAALNRRANQLARHLQTLGVGPDVRVGLCLERSLDMLVGMLGILKAGGAYVPLDPMLPQERLAFMLADAQAPVLVAQQRLRLALPIDGIAIVYMDGAWPIITHMCDDQPACSARSNHLVYVLFTSGSTGRPKGVAVEHRQLAHYLNGIVGQLALPRGANFALVSTFAADLGNTVIFPSLCTGGCLHIVSQERASDPDLLADYFSRKQIDCLKVVPSHLMALLKAAHPEQVIPRRLLVLGGEATSWQLIERIQQLAPGCRILNHYGPTETTVGVLTYDVEPTPAYKREVTLPLGYPLANTQLHVLGSDLHPVPAGEAGELYVGGSGLTRGYLGRPDLTAQQFIPNPFSAEPGERLYKTGDLARYLPCGAIMFLGRVDHQVKIRGFRIELGEIEAALRRHPGVQTAIVLVREDVAGDRVLVAYVVPEVQQTLATSELRAYLKTTLPEYMRPSSFVLLNALPLTSNGKIDRRALPEPDHTRASLDTDFVAPRNPVEEQLAKIWAELLGCATIGIDDNFFELGGHSLLAAQAVSRVRMTFQVELPLRSFFDTPTVRGLAEAVSAHAPAPDAEGNTTTQTHMIAVRAQNTVLSASFAQQRLWFLDQLAPGKAFYTIPVAIRLTGSLDYAALAHSLNAIVQRHEALRTTFTSCGGQPIQVIAPTLSLPLPLLDLQALPPATREDIARQLATQQAQRPFNLTRGPLLRATIVRLDATDHLLVLTLHHAIADGWSTEVLFRELGQLYSATVTAQPAALPELPIQYADYALWQREWLNGAVLETQLAYWRQQLAGAPTLLELPSDHPRPSVQSFRGATHTLALPAGLRAALVTLSQREGVTLFMTLLAAWQVLLARYSGQDDIVVGSPIAGRTHTEVEQLIGFFVNTLVLRTDLSGNPSFREVLGRVREVCLGAYAHQDVPFEKLVEELHPDRTLSFNPLVQASLALQNDPLHSQALHGLTAERLELDSGRARFDVALLLQNTADELVGTVEYSTDLFEASTIARMARHFQTLLEGIVANVDTRIATFPLVTGGERQDLLFTWNATQAGFPTDRCIQQLFEEQAARTPDATAIIFENKRLTYHELNERANQLAHYLQARGVGPDVPVGICMERSLELVIGLLGVLKAGGAYIPIDPAYPEDRLTFILQDAQAPMLLTQARLAEWLRVYRGKVVRLDADWETISDEMTTDNPAHTATPDHLAYVIYTSGSTGRPKGVQINHRSLVNLVCWHQRTFSVTRDDRASMVAGLGFDATVWELWPYLAGGASLCIVSEELRAAPEQMRDWLLQQAITISFLPTPMAERIIALEWPAKLALRTMLTGGDTLQQAPPATLPFVLVNNYGPTESTVVTTSSVVLPNADANVAPSIGRPIANIQVYLLDAQLQPVPVGVVGELYIGGDGLARGYLGRPDLTAQRFIPNPFSASAGARLYKTGDLARYQANGEIAFLGRADFQVKIRGFRIELGEIETMLRRHSDVQDVVVVAREADELAASQSREQSEDENSDAALAKGSKMLVAYVVPKAGPPPTSRVLRSFLREKLPDYMVPCAFVLLDELPLTANGKVDRRALPAPDTSRPELEVTFVAPRTPVEEVLAQIWIDILGRDHIGVNDNFFGLGGHSLLATRVIAQIQDALQVELPLRSLFEAPTVAELATTVLQRSENWAQVERKAQLLLWLTRLSEDEMETLVIQEKLLSREV